MSLIIMILLLSFLILIHEAGHFLAARMLGIKVDKFGFGLPIGPTLWSKKVGEVEVLVHACLLGGYVAFPDDDKDSDLPLDSKDRFINRPVWQRMIVISAGVIANVIIAIVLVMLTAGLWGKLPSGNYEVYINKIQSSSNNVGLLKGDKVLKINDSEINSSYAFTLFAKNSAQFDGKVDKNFADKNFKILQNLKPQIDTFHEIPEGTMVILPEKIEDEPALKIDNNTLKGYAVYKNDEIKLTQKQIKLRDKIKSKNKLISEGDITLKDLAYSLSDGLKPLNIIVERNGQKISIPPIYPNEKGLVGVMLDSKQILTPTKTPLQIFSKSCRYIWEQTYMLVYGLWQLFSGKIPAKDLHGIVVIAKIGGDVIHNSGIFSGILLTAMISMDLALVNFLPIPALDGGHFMFLVLETIRKKPVKQETIDRVSSFFFILLIIFMVLVIFNDIYALVKHQL